MAEENWFATFVSNKVNQLKKDAEELIPDSMCQWLEHPGRVVYFDGRGLKRGTEDHNPLDWPVVATHPTWQSCEGDTNRVRIQILLNFDGLENDDYECAR